MSIDKEKLKNKILYRSSYRGTKEMDILMNGFVKSVINILNETELLELDKLVDLDDIELKKIKEGLDNQKFTTNNLIKKFQNFNN
tara:strand:+ start:340 stop:594 length:255 start_codon:yes stop_codon:yes gene_type:complete